MTRCAPALVFLAVLIGLFAVPFGCAPEKRLTGSWKAPHPTDPSITVELKLEADGKGSWKVGRDSAAFKWDTRGSEIWLHYRSGGVVSGKLGEDQSIAVEVPGVGPLRFEKTT